MAMHFFFTRRSANEMGFNCREDKCCRKSPSFLILEENPVCPGLDHQANWISVELLKLIGQQSTRLKCFGDLTTRNREMGVDHSEPQERPGSGAMILIFTALAGSE